VVVLGEPSVSRNLFVASLLVEPAPPDEEPTAAYNEDRDLMLLLDGTPLVEAAGGGTDTLTKSAGERDDADEHAGSSVSLGTLTTTSVNGEREDDDAPVAWGGTQLSTRRLPADVEQD
jgi:hypothetical protein